MERHTSARNYQRFTFCLYPDGGKRVNCTLVQGLRLCTGRTTHRGSRGIALLFHDHGTRRGWRISVTPRPLFTLGNDPVPIVQEAGWAPGPVWTGAENLAYTGIRSPDRPVRSQSLYWLSYPGPHPDDGEEEFSVPLLAFHLVTHCHNLEDTTNFSAKLVHSEGDVKSEVTQ